MVKRAPCMSLVSTKVCYHVRSLGLARDQDTALVGTLLSFL